MKKRVIAVVMLASLWCGAASGAFAFSMLRSNAQEAGEPSPSSPHKHSCCPGVHPPLTLALFETSTAPAMPCGNEHPCCAKRAPQSPASRPAVYGSPRPGGLEMAVSGAEVVADSRVNIGSRGVGDESFLPSYFARSTVLRI